jgi:hypothetical protein
VCPIYVLCLLMHLPRLETSDALALPDLMCRHSHGSPRDLRAARKMACAERRPPVRDGITSKLTWIRRLACSR